MADNEQYIDDVFTQLSTDMDYVLDVADTSYVETMDWQREKRVIKIRMTECFKKLQSEVERLRAENAAMRSVLAIAWGDIIRAKSASTIGCSCYTCESARELLTKEEAETLLYPTQDDA